ncbi:3'-5' exonuclease [Pasteurellaceae bacterium 22721_9_1]
MVLKYFLNQFHPLVKLEKQRIEMLQRIDYPAPLAKALSFAYPSSDADLSQLSFLVIDFETTGLNSLMDNVLSVAAVPIDNLSIQLASSMHMFVEQKIVKKDTAVINHIVPQMLTDASSLDEAMQQLFSLMQGRILIAHGASIEKRFILHYLSVRYNITQLPMLWLDTLRIERSFADPQAQHYQLASIRQKYHLPGYITHNALVDAVATGELFLAQLVRIFGSQKKSLGEIYKRSLF